MQAFKIKSLKKISAIVVAVISTSAFQPVQAAPFTVSGRVNAVAVADASLGTFNLVGVSSIGSCPTFFGVVGLTFKDDLHGQQMLAILLAAATSGSTVSVNVDDSVRAPNGGFCYASGIALIGN